MMDRRRAKNDTGTEQMIEEYLQQLVLESTPLRPIWDREGERKGGGYNWSYVNALFMTALLCLGQREETKAYTAFAEAFMDAYVTPEGGIHSYRVEEYNIDHICGGCVLMDLYQLTGKEKYGKAVDHLMSQLLSQPRTREGNFWHKKIYPNQVWLDGLYMAQPFYMRYGMEHEKEEYCLDSFRQFQTVKERMKDTDTGLYYHGYDASGTAFWADKKTGCSRSFWLRSIGWLAMACVDTLELVSRGWETEKKRLNRMFRDLMDAVIRFQEKESGMWYQVMDQGGREGNYLETSGSAMLSYALMKGARLGYLPASYRHFGKKAFEGICNYKLSRKNGSMNLEGICLVAGLGGAGVRRDGTYGYYISEPVVENEGKGIGPFILAYVESGLDDRMGWTKECGNG